MCIRDRAGLLGGSGRPRWSGPRSATRSNIALGSRGQAAAKRSRIHTDLVCELAGIGPGMRVLDAGCGIGAPARRIAARIDCEIVGVNISREQVRQGRELIARAGLAARVDIRHGNVLNMPLPGGGFDAAICLEAAGDICVRAADKPRLVAELRRAGGSVSATWCLTGGRPWRRTGRCARCSTTPAASWSPIGRPCSPRPASGSGGARHPGADAADLAARPGGSPPARGAATGRYGRRLAAGIARRADRQVARVAAAIERCGSYPALSATAPSTPPPPPRPCTTPVRTPARRKIIARGGCSAVPRHRDTSDRPRLHRPWTDTETGHFPQT